MRDRGLFCQQRMQICNKVGAEKHRNTKRNAALFRARNR